MVAGEVVEHLYQLFCIRHRAHALQQQHHPRPLRQGHQGGQAADDGLPIRADGVQHHIGRQEVASRLHSGLGLPLLVHQVGLHAHAGDGEPLPQQLAAGGHGQLRVGGAVFGSQEGVPHTVDLQAAQLGVHGGGAELAPVHIGPVPDGIRKFHRIASPHACS